MIVSRYITTTTSEGKRLNTVVCFGTDNTDPRQGYNVAPFGFDSVGTQNLQAVYADTANNRYPIILGWLNTSVVAQEGESRMYSTDSNGGVVGYVYLKNNGELNLLGDSNWAVKYTELASQFNELKGKFNDLVSKWNAFCTDYVPGSPTTAGQPLTLTTDTVSPSTADITQSKNTRIKTN
jgi:hypothetical protein